MLDSLYLSLIDVIPRCSWISLFVLVYSLIFKTTSKHYIFVAIGTGLSHF